MLFNSVGFIFVFLPAVAVCFYALPAQWRPHFLLAASLLFYSMTDIRLTPLLLASIAANYFIGSAIIQRMESGDQVTAGRLAIGGVALNLAILAFFKYRYFISDLAGTPLAGELVIPLAISFYTFQQISFLVDAWRGQAERVSFVRYAAFVTFFPHLIAGPIFRHNELIPQFGRDSRPQAYENILVGFSIFALGLFKKVGIADALSGYAAPVFEMVRAGKEVSTFDAWSALLSYHFQIYFDFSGYSTMAIGLGKMLGIDLPLNFRSPYKADSIIDFWRCWHITLSRFLRDYLYIPLGGNRHGSARRYTNLIITMALGGLWHGAAWGFLLWGLLHGFYLVVNHAWHRFAGRSMPSFPGIALTFTAVALAWVPFRAETFDATMLFYASMMHGQAPSMNAVAEIAPLLILAACITFFLPTVEQVMGYDREAAPAFRWSPTLRWAAVVGIAFTVSVAGIVAVGKSSEFLYFKF